MSVPIYLIEGESHNPATLGDVPYLPHPGDLLTLHGTSDPAPDMNKQDVPTFRVKDVTHKTRWDSETQRFTTDLILVSVERVSQPHPGIRVIGD
jgi:hypothetical protein